MYQAYPAPGCAQVSGRLYASIKLRTVFEEGPILSSPSKQQIRAAVEVLRNASYQDIQELGYHFQANDYYSPLNDLRFLRENPDLWKTPFVPLDIDWRIEHQMSVAGEIAPFLEELRDVPENSADPGRYHWNNNFWNNADALVQYGLLRSRKPSRVVEVGCGYSSLLMARALAINDAEPGRAPTKVTLIEPHPNAGVLAGIPGHWEFHKTPLQRAPAEIFAALGPGDFLFYDGSHCCKVASDVNWMFFRILPMLASGVLIHVHDIFFPVEYPEPWIFERGQTWNEQYCLQAFLMNNSRYSIEIANACLAWHRGPEVAQLYKGIQPHSGASFWMIKN
jgi:hypothetical protein